MGTIIVSIILVAVVTCVIISMVKAKRSGKQCSCGGSCSSCGGACHAGKR